MKTNYLCLIFLIFIYACSSDSETTTSATAEHALAKDSSNENAPDVRANANNPYDIAGRLHDEVLNTCQAEGPLPVTLSGIINRVEIVANNNPIFYALAGTTYQPLSAVRLQYILDNPFLSRIAIIQESAMSLKAQSDINSFIDEVLPLCGGNASYDAIYDFVVGYEALVLADGGLTAYDKKVILTATSMVRYAAYKRKRPKKNTDLDWELNVTHIVGSIEGSSFGTSEAITTGLCLGFANHL